MTINHDEITTLREQLATVLRREADTITRHDKRVDELENSLSALRAENERLRDALRNGRTLLIAWQAQHPDDAVLAACVDNMRAALGGDPSSPSTS